MIHTTRFLRLIAISGVLIAGSSALAPPVSAVPTCFGQPATVNDHVGNIDGTSGDDVITGSAGVNTIEGKGGNDVICGGNGNDTLTGAGGVDKFDAGGGNDTLYSRDGRRETTIRGGSGTDRARRDNSDVTRSVERRF